ncbi:MAG: Chromosome partition protein Smc [Accumulibacter sp.]|uniref:AAA family ATPase n=1 Tax=Accumulibacter sp. TaxID=2053492 RepID=UPI0011FB9D29|nr:AAA family ATPase [Accumulibacter sp.]TLD45444.1 MAG: Chromosome partition protein Smc [Accumulibacter sp.]
MFRFEKLELVHWDYWQRLEIPLAAPIVTIVGPNGSGKTTLLDALRTLLALECSGHGSRKRDYKRYVRRNGEDFAWLRAVVDNRRLPNHRRPFWPPHQEEQVTLACRIERKGGDWARVYFLAAGDVAIEGIETEGTEYGVRDWRQLLHQAGLTPALARVLSLEQGQTDKLCELSGRELLDLVFQVFGDKETLDRYAEARAHQELVNAELKAMQGEESRLANELERFEQKVNRHLEWQALASERQALAAETRPRLEFHSLNESIRGARRQLAATRRDWRRARDELRARSDELPLRQQAVHAGVAARLAAETAEQVANAALNQANAERTRWLTRLEERQRLLAAARVEGGDPLADQEALERAEAERDGLRLQLAAGSAELAQVAELLHNLSAGRRADPADVSRFRAALHGAGIGHSLLAERLEITDEGWSNAVEAVLAPFAHIVLLDDPQQAEEAFVLGERLLYRHYVVPETVAVPAAGAGSLLEVLRLTGPVPEWLIHVLQRTQRVEDAAVGARLPRGQDWVSRQGYLRERRGGRHAAPGLPRFGQARMAALRQRQGELENDLAPLRQRLHEVERDIAARRQRLSGSDARRDLAARAGEFAEAGNALQRADEAHRSAARAAQGARQARQESEEALRAAQLAETAIASQIAALRSSLPGLENLAGRREQAERLRRLRRQRRELPLAWQETAGNQALAEQWGDVRAIDRRLAEIERRFAQESWETDATVVALRDNLRDSLQRQQREVSDRRRDNDMARAQTDAARSEYVKVLRHTASRYAKNLRLLGEMAGVRVEVELPPLAADESSLAQAALVVRFEFDAKGLMGMNDSDASGGQQVVKSLILLVGLMMEEAHPGGFVFIDEPFAHLDIMNIERVSAFLRATRAQYLLTTPVTHNVGVYDPAAITLVTAKKRPDERWASRVGVLVRQAADLATPAGNA